MIRTDTVSILLVLVKVGGSGAPGLIPVISGALLVADSVVHEGKHAQRSVSIAPACSNWN